MPKIYLASAAFIGGMVAMMADLIQKDVASATLKMANSFQEHLGIAHATFVAICLVLFIAVALCFIFEVQTPKNAFYTGASVLAILMTVVPYNLPKDFQTKPNSVEVSLTIKTQDGKPISNAVVTLRNAVNGNIVAQRKTSEDGLRFYQAAGTYRLSVEMSGYQGESLSLVLIEGSPTQRVSVNLRPSDAPLFWQRLLR